MINFGILCFPGKNEEEEIKKEDAFS